MPGILRSNEPDDVFVELVEALAASTVPMLILGALVLLIGGHAFAVSQSPAVLAATGFSLVVALIKIVLVLRHRRAQQTGCRPGILQVRRREAFHAVSTFSVGGSVGILTATIFSVPDVSLHLTATSLMFGYCAGVINRISIRPRIALGAVVCAGLPGILAAAIGGTQAHLVLMIVFGGFLGGAIQSITYVYETALREVTLRLQLSRLARRDPLTGLYNRLGLSEACDALPREGSSLVAVHAFDLDGFKAVNDGLGHAAGDRLLAILAGRIRPIVPENAIVARTGGDEFVLVQTGARTPDDVRDLARRIHAELTAPYDIGGDRTIRVGLSLGHAFAPLAQADLGDLTRRADAASYAAKRAGGGVRAHGEHAAPPLLPVMARPNLARSA